MEINPNMNLDDAVPTESKYLKKEDVGEAGKNLKIAGLSRVDIDDKRKTVMAWTDSTVKPMVLNPTNKNLLVHITGATKVIGILGFTVNVYNDPLIDFGGKIVGGIRIRAAKVAGEPEGGTMARDEALAKHGPTPEQLAGIAANSLDAGPAPTGPEFDDDIPF